MYPKHFSKAAYLSSYVSNSFHINVSLLFWLGQIIIFNNFSIMHITLGFLCCSLSLKHMPFKKVRHKANTTCAS